MQKLLNASSQNLLEKWRYGPWKMPVDFGCNPDKVTLGSGLWHYRHIQHVLYGVRFMVLILRHQRPWRKYIYLCA